MVGVIDYGLGNLGSILNMLRVLGAKAELVNDRAGIEYADKIILPGVGAFDTGMANLNEACLAEVIKEQALEARKPILGICLGMQMLGRGSEEGSLPGLGLIPFDTKRFQLDNTELRVPHMGWDIVSIEQSNSLVRGIDDGERYYFVHSYHAICDSADNVLMKCDYGYEFDAAVVNGNVYGTQFHPEKSHNFGLKLLKNFVEVC